MNVPILSVHFVNFDTSINSCNHKPNQETENFQHTKIFSSISARSPNPAPITFLVI